MSICYFHSSFSFSFSFSFVLFSGSFERLLYLSVESVAVSSGCSVVAAAQAFWRRGSRWSSRGKWRGKEPNKQTSKSFVSAVRVSSRYCRYFLNSSIQFRSHHVLKRQTVRVYTWLLKCSVSPGNQWFIKPQMHIRTSVQQGQFLQQYFFLVDNLFFTISLQLL